MKHSQFNHPVRRATNYRNIKRLKNINARTNDTYKYLSKVRSDIFTMSVFLVTKKRTGNRLSVVYNDGVNRKPWDQRTKNPNTKVHSLHGSSSVLIHTLECQKTGRSVDKPDTQRPQIKNCLIQYICTSECCRLIRNWKCSTCGPEWGKTDRGNGCFTAEVRKCHRTDGIHVTLLLTVAYATCIHIAFTNQRKSHVTWQGRTRFNSVRCTVTGDPNLHLLKSNALCTVWTTSLFPLNKMGSSETPVCVDC